MDGILETVKKIITGDEYGPDFDTDILVAINMVFAELTQMGVGPKEGFMVLDETAKWTDFIDSMEVGLLRQLVPLKVRLIFDPPSSSAVMDAIKEQIKELEWRLYVAFDTNGGFRKDGKLLDNSV